MGFQYRTPIWFSADDVCEWKPCVDILIFVIQLKLVLSAWFYAYYAHSFVFLYKLLVPEKNKLFACGVMALLMFRLFRFEALSTHSMLNWRAIGLQSRVKPLVLNEHAAKKKKEECLMKSSLSQTKEQK